MVAFVFDIEHPPTLLGPTEMQAILRINKSMFHRREQRGEFDQLKTSPAIGPKCYSGVLVARWLKGEPLYVPSFGRRKSA